MRKYGMYLLFQFLFFAAAAQTMDLKDLTDLMDISPNRLDNVLIKRGFKKDVITLEHESAHMAFQRNNKEGTRRQFFFLDTDNKIVYETNCPKEFGELQTQIKSAGFTTPYDDSTNIQLKIYQKQLFTIETETRLEDTVQYYILKLTKKNIPKKKEVLFAEDILILDSHEYLGEMFGKDNVRMEYFYYAEDDSARCSVIFPNTTSEAIVVWKDEINLRKIEFILIGGSLRNTQSQPLAQGFNTWRSRQGAFCGMNLKELEALNGEPVKFFNWHTEAPGYLHPKNSGKINFNQLGLVLRCLNCSFIKVSDNNVIDTTTAMNELQKIFVSGLIILPNKK